MKKVGTRRIETERCYLRRLTVEDSQQLFENVFGDERSAQYMSWEKYTDEKAVENYLAEFGIDA